MPRSAASYARAKHVSRMEIVGVKQLKRMASLGNFHVLVENRSTQSLGSLILSSIEMKYTSSYPGFVTGISSGMSWIK